MEFALHFYKALFENESSRKYLEYALMNAKRELHEACEAEQRPNSTWAAPVLVMQVDRPQSSFVPQRPAERASRAAVH